MIGAFQPPRGVPDETDPCLRRRVRNLRRSPDDRRAPGSAARRRADRDRLLRRVSFGPAFRQQRLGDDRLPGGARPRDRRHGDRGRRRRHPLRSRPARRRRLPGRLLPRVPVVRRRPGAVLPEGIRRHLQRGGPARRPQDLWRLFGAHRGFRAIRAEHPRLAGPGRCRAAAVRGHHDLVAAAPLRRQGRRPGRDRRHGRSGPHGHQVRPGPGRGSHRVLAFGRQALGDRTPGSAPHGDLHRRRTDGGRGRPLRLHPEHGAGAARPEPLRGGAETRRHADPGRSARADRAGTGSRSDRVRAAAPGRFPDRGAARDPGDARLLCRARHRQRHRDARHQEHQRSLQADAGQRRALSLRHRHGQPQGRRSGAGADRSGPGAWVSSRRGCETAARANGPSRPRRAPAACRPACGRSRPLRAAARGSPSRRRRRR